MGNETARIDKWLWAARIFKTRSIAANACKNGRVTVNGTTVKPSRSIKCGEVVSVKKPPVTYSFKVLQCIEQRVGAKLVPQIYENVTDAKQYADGSFAEPFSPLKWGDAFTEGNAWHYTWSVFHDPEGLKQLMGGEKRFVAMLDSVFSVPPVYDDSYYGFPIHEIREMTVMNMGNYAHGNQPIQHMIYLYDWTDQPWKTQYHVREVMDRMYSATPDGYCGDEDNGQTSAWYVFSALGFYPVTPASDQYALGSPLFRKAVLKFENGRSLILNADNNTNDTPYIAGLMVNGTDYNRNYITHGMLLDGGQIDFDMVSAPNMSKQINKDSYPYSFSCDEIK